MTVPRIRASAIILKNNQVLLIHRHKSEEVYWVFPGGGIEKGEEPLEAAKREVKEETSLNITKIIDQKTYPDSENPEFKHFFIVCEVEDRIPKVGYEPADTSLEVDTFEIEWLNISEALKLEKLYPVVVKNHLRDMQHEAHRS